jgi:hypothetical protein
MSARRRGGALAVLALLPLGDAAAQTTYGQCADRARDRYMRGQVDPVIGPDRALDAYKGDLRECVRLDAQNRTSEAKRDQRQDQQRLDQQRQDQQLEQQRLDQQRLDQQRADQQRLNQLRARQRDDMLRNQR